MWCQTSDTGFAQHGRTLSSGTGYYVYFTQPMSTFWITSHMIILTQHSDTIWFCLWTTKFQCWKLGCITKHLSIFVLNIRILLHRILPLCPLYFSCPFLYFPWSITPYLCAALVLFKKKLGLTNISGRIFRVYYHLNVIQFWTW